MSTLVVTPAAAIVSLEDAKQHLRVDADDTGQDNVIKGIIAAVTGYLDGPQGSLGRALAQQTLEERRQAFPGPLCGMYDPQLPAWRLDEEFFVVSCPPIISVTSISYPTDTGVRVEVDLTALPYDDTRISMPLGGWPAARREIGGVRVRYQAGYLTVPAPIRQAILLMIGTLYDNRAAAPETAFAGAAASLLSPYARVA